MKKQSVLLDYIIKNKKNFILIIGIFLFGLILGILFVNNANENQINEIKQYVTELIENVKRNENISKIDLLSKSLTQNIISIFIVWFLGCTIIGSIFVFVNIAYKGFSLGYTISSIIACLGVKKGCVFTIAGLFLQNIFYLPAFFLICESGIKLYKGIYRHQINLKLEVVRHSIIMLIAIMISVISSFIEVYGSTNFLIFLKDFL